LCARIQILALEFRKATLGLLLILVAHELLLRQTSLFGLQPLLLLKVPLCLHLRLLLLALGVFPLLLQPSLFRMPPLVVLPELVDRFRVD
jgi:hypothetical protein